MSVQSTKQTTVAKSTIATLACRLLALFFFTQVVTTLATFVMAIIAGFASPSRHEGGDIVVLIMAAAPTLILLAITIFLWKRAEWIGARMLPQSDDPFVISGFSSQKLLSVAFAAIGMYVFVYALLQLGRHLAVAFWENSRFADSWNNANWQIGFWVNIFQIGIGAWLMLGMHGIARAVRSLQRGNVPEDETIPSDQNIQ